MSKMYNYKVVDTNGEIHEGVHEADSKNELLDVIRSRGQKPIKIDLANDAADREFSPSIFTRNPNTKDMVVFSRQLYTMLNAGMPLISGLDVLIDQSENLKLKKTLAEITEKVKKGRMLSDAMSDYPKIFPMLLVNMIKAGEMTGNLDDVLLKMSVHYDKENKLNAKIKRAMIYPAVLFTLAIAAVTFLLTFVLPTIVGMFENSDVELPVPTQIVLALSHSISNYWYMYIAGFLGIVLAYKSIIKTQSGKTFKDKLALNFPLVGKHVRKVVTSRFTRTLSTLLGSGIPILDALETSAKVTDNEVLIDKIHEVSEKIKKGNSLSSLLDKISLFPKMTISMVNIGEESGAIEDMLEKTADYYDDELEDALGKLVALIEPLGILLMALLIGFIVIAMMLPMFSMYETL